MARTRTFASPCSTVGSNRTWSREWYTSYLNAAAPSNCVAEATVAAMDGNWVLDTTSGRTTNSSDGAWQPANRGLRVGWVDEFDEVETDGASHDYASVKPRWVRDEGTMVSRWPMNYRPGQKVLLTFENVQYARYDGAAFDAASVKYDGQAPVAVTTNGGQFNLSYVVPVSSSGTLTVGLTVDGTNTFDYDTGWFTKGNDQERTNNHYRAQHVSFTGFHNSTINILYPRGSAALTGNDWKKAWKGSPLFQWDFQSLDGNLMQDYTLPWSVYILGVCEPLVLRWHLEATAGTLSQDDAVSPYHFPPTGVTACQEGMLSLWNDPVSAKKIQVFQDHLARDMENFGSSQSCRGGPTTDWQTPFGWIRMDHDWNCHGSVQHAHNGKGNGNLGGGKYGPPFFVQDWGELWNVHQYSYPFNADAIQAINGMQRGSVVAYLGSPSEFDTEGCIHSATSIGGPMTWGVNNAPLDEHLNECHCFAISSVYEIMRRFNDVYRSVTNIIIYSKP